MVWGNGLRRLNSSVLRANSMWILVADDNDIDRTGVNDILRSEEG